MSTQRFKTDQTVMVTAPSESYRKWQDRTVTIIQVADYADHAHGWAYEVQSNGERAWMWESWLSDPTRVELITGFRQLADFLTVNPDVAVPAFCRIQISTHGTDEEDRAAVDAFAAAAGVEAAYTDEERTHYEAGLQFGPIEYFIVAITAAHMDDFNERNRLGNEALAAKKAAEAQPVYDNAVVPAGWCCAESYAKQDACDECKTGVTS